MLIYLSALETDNEKREYLNTRSVLSEYFIRITAKISTTHSAMMQVYQLTLSPANMGSPRRVSVLQANTRKMQVCCHLYSKHKTRSLIIPCVQSCVFKIKTGATTYANEKTAVEHREM